MRARWTELLLLALAGGLAAAAAAPSALQATGRAGFWDLVPVISLFALLGAVHLGLVARGAGADQVLLPVVGALMGLGLALAGRLAPALFVRQWTWLLVGAAALGLAAIWPADVSLLRRHRYSWALLGTLLVAATLVAGRATVPGGPRLWLGVGPLFFQPAEAMKLLLVVFLAGYLEDKSELLAEGGRRLWRWHLPPVPYLAPLGVLLGLSLALLAVQGDLGAALVLFAIALAMLYLASGRAAYVVAGLGLFLVGAWALHGHVPVVQTRVAIWLDPWSDAQGTGYQVIQALMAVAGGGAFGSGLGLGAATSIPAVHTDFVFAAIVEELGLAGAGAVLTLYALLTLRGFRVAIRATAPFVRLLAAGLTFALTAQTFIILAGLLRLIPLTGITLPFLSVGGSSVLVSAVSVGLLLNIGRAREAR